MIVLNDIHVRIGERQLFDALSCTIHGGQRVGIVGRNGIGKSTLFLVLRGRLLPEEGDVQVPTSWRIAVLDQETPASDRSALDWVLDGDRDLRRVQKQIAQAESAGDNDALARHYSRYEDLDGYSAEARAAGILHGLGFEASQFDEPYRSFSGGWRIRLNLAQTLMAPSELLLLDEPTNHLDLDALLWLEQYLLRYPGTLITIAHDRDFLDSIATDIIHLEHGKAWQYSGNYSSFERQRGERLALQEAVFRKQQHQLSHMKKFVDRFRAKASKARLVQSRLKAMERLQAQAPAYSDSPYEFSFPNPDKVSNPILAADDLDLGYDGQAVLHDLTLRIYPGNRIGLLGANGAGKSTLVKALAGELKPLRGEMHWGAHSSVGYFAQHQLEQLDPKRSALAQLTDLSELPEQKLRTYLGGWGFSGDRALQPIGTLSGGEKARLVLALVAWHKPVLLLLDEPTNHLDLEMRHALTVALQAYDGAMILVSHDREMLANSVDEYWLLQDGRMQRYDGGIESYSRELQSRFALPGATGAAPPAAAAKKKEQRQAAAARREESKPLRQKVKKLEGEMNRLSGALKALEEKLADPALYDGDGPEIAGLLKEQGQLQQALAETEEAWLEAQEALEALMA
jgi:ATP-binding cassette, subfamily F, member 3